MLLRIGHRLWMRNTLLLAVAPLLMLPSFAAAQSIDPNSDRYSECTPGVRGYGNYSVITLPGVPFTATMKVTVLKKQPDGTTVSTVSHLFNARDSNGKVRIENSVGVGCARDKDGRPYDIVLVHIADPVTQTHLNWHAGPNAQKVAQLAHQPGPWADPQLSMRWQDNSYVQKEPGQPDKTIRAESIGSKVIHGIQVQGRRTTVTTPPSDQGNTQPSVVVHEWWISTTLGVVVADMKDDPVQGHVEMELENFTIGEPDPSVFQPPAGYTVIDQSITQAAPRSVTQAPTRSPTQAVTPSPTGLNPCSNVTRHVQDPRFAPGQRYSYQTRPQDVGSTLTIMEIDQVPQLGIVLWVSVDHFHMPVLPAGGPDRFANGGFPVTRDALEASSIRPHSR